ncbi:MAG: hypothetical protein HYZ42_15655, partial [Bacteroidetes bacterium]|nr:hypothetical protein [Bacteroidota bacterium]
EPLEGFEPNAQDKIINYLTDKSKATTTFIISNNKELASKCQYHLVMSKGKITKQ